MHKNLGVLTTLLENSEKVRVAVTVADIKDKFARSTKLYKTYKTLMWIKALGAKPAVPIRRGEKLAFL